jgi:SAM-dependent methyltransferase
MILRGESVLPKEPSAVAASPSDPQDLRCLICGGQTVERFSKLFQGTNVHYFMCMTCNHLTAGEINTNPAYDGGAYFREIDTGWEGRNKTILDFIGLITRLPAICLSARSAVLDFGCGNGRLVADLNSLGFRAYGFEPYAESESLSDRIFTNWGQARRTVGQADLIMCIEVLEHLRNPEDALEEISRTLVPSGYLLISAETYEDGVHTEDWYYLNPAAGHVSIFSERSLLFLLSKYHFEPVLRISGSVWLFRNISTRRRNVLERGYFKLSALRVKWRMRQHHRREAQARSSRQIENGTVAK